MISDFGVGLVYMGEMGRMDMDVDTEHQEMTKKSFSHLQMMISESFRALDCSGK